MFLSKIVIDLCLDACKAVGMKRSVESPMMRRVGLTAARSPLRGGL